MALEILTAGPMATVQDMGREGCADRGYRRCGACDKYAMRLANILAGNREQAGAACAVIEFTLYGGRLRFTEPTVFTLAGAAMPAALDGRAVPMFASLEAAAGQVLELGAAERGLRTYLAVRGGIDVPPVLGSRSTDTACMIGGFRGRALQSGDVLQIGRELPGWQTGYPDQNLPGRQAGDSDQELSGRQTSRHDWKQPERQTSGLCRELPGQQTSGLAQGQSDQWESDPACAGWDAGRLFTGPLGRPALGPELSWLRQASFRYRSMGPELIPVLRIVAGPQDDSFCPEAFERLRHEVYRVSVDSNRMACRLEGPALPAKDGYDIVSDGIAEGSVQVSANGQPMVMLADHQTTGGYAKIGTVISADLPAIAQSRPGDHIAFLFVTPQEANEAYRLEERKLRWLARQCDQTA